MFKLLFAQSAGAVEFTPSNECPGMTIWWWDSSDAGGLGNVEHSFIASAPISTLSRIGSTW